MSVTCNERVFIMNSTITPSPAGKIVVGIALAAVFGGGLYIYVARSEHAMQVARATPAPISASAALPPPGSGAAASEATASATASAPPSAPVNEAAAARD